jgi:hypothetical protein
MKKLGEKSSLNDVLLIGSDLERVGPLGHDIEMVSSFLRSTDKLPVPIWALPGTVTQLQLLKRISTN